MSGGGLKTDRQDVVLQKAVFYLVKGKLSAPERRSFTMQKTAFCNPSDYQRLTKAFAGVAGGTAFLSVKRACSIFTI